MGSHGQLGRGIGGSASANIKLHAFNFSELDICNLAQHESVYKDLAPTTIINAAGYTQVDKAESAKKWLRRIFISCT